MFNLWIGPSAIWTSFSSCAFLSVGVFVCYFWLLFTFSYSIPTAVFVVSPCDTHTLVLFFPWPASSLNVTDHKHLSEECRDKCFQSSLHSTEGAFAFWKRRKVAAFFWSRVFICKPYAIFGVSNMKASCVKPIKKKITGDLEQWLRSQQAWLHDTCVIKIAFALASLHEIFFSFRC